MHAGADADKSVSCYALTNLLRAHDYGFLLPCDRGSCDCRSSHSQSFHLVKILPLARHYVALTMASPRTPAP